MPRTKLMYVSAALGMLVLLDSATLAMVDNTPVAIQLEHLSLNDAVRSSRFNVSQIENKICVFECVRIHCEGPCRIIAEKLHKIEAGFQGNSEVLFITLLLDGEKCTPDEVRSFSQGDAERANNIYLRGSDDTVEKTLEIMYAGIISEATQGGLLLNTRWVVIDQSSHIHGYYSSLDKDNRENMVADIQSLIKVWK